MIPTQDDNRPHIAIIGAGIAGCALAYELSKWSCRISLLESGRIGEQGASAVPLALINPHRGRSARASALDRAGLFAMRDLAIELQQQGLSHGIDFSGVIRIPANARQARQWQKLGLSYVPPEKVAAAYHAPFGALLIREGGQLQPRLLLSALSRAAAQRGVTIMEGFTVTDISGSRICATDASLEADMVILCSGAQQLSQLPQPELEYLAGDMLCLESSLALPYPLAGAVYGGRSKDGVCVGGNHRAGEQAEPEALAGLQKAVSWFIPQLAQTKLSRVWTGVRARTADNQPLFTQLAAKLWFFGAFGGRGFLCARYLAQQVAKQLSQQLSLKARAETRLP